jgi:hypothetical protein
MPVNPRPVAVVLCLLASAALGACGGGGFSGEAGVPDGYETYSTAGISFAYPADWEVEARTDAEGVPAVQMTPPEKSETPYGLILLSISPKAGDRFQSLADQRRNVVRDVNDAKIDSDEPVEIAGAEQALRATATTPPGEGTDPVEVKADSLDVLRENGDVVVLTVASPQRKGQTFDPAPIVESFRLEG